MLCHQKQTVAYCVPFLPWRPVTLSTVTVRPLSWIKGVYQWQREMASFNRQVGILLPPALLQMTPCSACYWLVVAGTRGRVPAVVTVCTIHQFILRLTHRWMARLSWLDTEMVTHRSKLLAGCDVDRDEHIATVDRQVTERDTALELHRVCIVTVISIQWLSL